MVGGPGSGKSHFAKTKLELNGYTLINRDELKTWQKCVEHLEASLKVILTSIIFFFSFIIKSLIGKEKRCN